MGEIHDSRHWAFAVMALAKLGKHDEAAAKLKQANESWTPTEVLKEAAAVLAAEKAKAAKPAGR